MIDTHRHRGLRQQLVNELKSKGIKNELILSAFMDIPRHYFLEKTFADWAYKDVAFPIDADQTISQPYTVAMQTTLLDIKKGDKVLEIGTGSGFQACVLSHMGAKVYTIERQKKLFDKTEKFLHDIGFGNIRTLYGDGYEGAPRFAPFDKILITAGASEIPEKLIEQLKPGGIMVIPLGQGDLQKMLRITKSEDGSLKKENFGNYRFVPFLKGVN
ncbi:MAG: protein-L-isoaspartate(D-aspartate) O-methyltransferase [Saprospiraceae bacterium]|nr:protein-L-isoaspartate(D-aspartate) O-methyltransferase [Saprospiraceae bacterium]MBP6569123.1 protein-L-isoaspartate(D-aspartate) O-methyltransferase [Saprospiraceae bacterium]